MNESDDNLRYIAASDRMSQEAEEAFRIWKNTVNPDVRKMLDIMEAEPPRKNDVGMTADIAESPRASFSPDLSALVDDLADELMEQFRFLSRRDDALCLANFIESRLKRDQESYNAWLLTRVIMRLTEAGNSKIVAVSLAFAAGFSEVWINRQLCRNQMEASKALGVSRQDLSKEVRKSAEWLEIEEGIHLKKPSAVESFKAAQMGDHWRKRKFKK